MSGPLFDNPRVASAHERSALAANYFPWSEFDEARSEIMAWPGYEPSPCLKLDRLAAASSLGAVYFKDEANRLGLKSFKILGGAYAVFALAKRRRSMPVNAAGDIIRDSESRLSELSFCCATDGNHGRAVAWAAKQVGGGCMIFLHEGVSKGREEALKRLGAEIIRVAGTYDDSVRAASTAARQHGWELVSDTDCDGAGDTPFLVMNGYRLLAEECLDQGVRPTHIFVQAGVGGLAAAMTAHFLQRLDYAPRIVIVEPDRADCLFQSARAGRPVRISGDLTTAMAGLSCGEPSRAVWPLIDACVDHFLRIEDDRALSAVRDLAAGCEGKPIESGESGAAGYAALKWVSRAPQLRSMLALNEDSRVLVFGTEGATDPEIYARVLAARNGADYALGA